MEITMDHGSTFRYRCNHCKRNFMVTSRDIHHDGSARCPECLGDDVTHWLNRRDRVLRFLMFYEAA